MNAHLENRKPEIVYNQCTGFENSYHLMAKMNILSAADLHKNTFTCFLWKILIVKRINSYDTVDTWAEL